MNDSLYTDPPKKGQIWQHFKGNKYEIVGLFQHSENGELLVGYIKCDSPNDVGCARPGRMWYDTVARDEYNGPRFVLISE